MPIFRYKHLVWFFVFLGMIVGVLYIFYLKETQPFVYSQYIELVVSWAADLWQITVDGVIRLSHQIGGAFHG
ncbi:MAG: hypothetical protein V1837_04985 [Candidatus Woesearchaeota archaeon]